MTVSLEIICVGNELLIGKVVNTNASWLGKRATSLGVLVNRIIVCRDDLSEIAQVLREALSRKPNFIVTTGGLGPTFDDKTLEGIALALNRKLSVNAAALDMVKAKYAEYAKTRSMGEADLTPPRIKMATIPDGSAPVFNPVGTAPGIRIDADETILIALPGVPKEMEAIFEESVAPLLREVAGDVSFFELSIFADNIMESVLAPLIDKVMHDIPIVYIKSHPKGRENHPHMELHLSTSGNKSQGPEEYLRKAALELSGFIEQAGGEIVKAETKIEVR